MNVASLTGGPRLLIYSQDGLGLGHLRRTTLLAAEFLRARPDGAVLTISDSPMGQFFSSAPGHDYLKLPSIRKLTPGNWSPVSLSLPFGSVLQMRKDVIRASAVSFQPDIMLVDHMPHGAMGELVPTLEALEALGVRTVLGLRDILDAPETIRRRWQLEGAFAAVDRHFDEVLVYGSADVFDVAEHYAWPDDLTGRLRYCGYVCSNPSATEASLRNEYLDGHPEAKLVVVMAGGGADGRDLFRSAVSAAPGLMAQQPCVFVVVTGPFLPQRDRFALHRLARDLPVHVLPTVNDSLGHLAAADLVVAMAGYNTTAEILRTGTRAILVPRRGPSAEQTMRASRFAERNWVDWLNPDELSPESLQAKMLHGLRSPRPPVTTLPDLRGRQRASGHLLSAFGAQPIPEVTLELDTPGPAVSVGAPKQLLSEG